MLVSALLLTPESQITKTEKNTPQRPSASFWPKTRVIRGVSRVCPGCVQGVSRVCQGCVKGVSRVCPGCVQGVSRVCPDG